MEKNRSSRIIALVALIIAIVGLSVGFAAFSNTLKISSRAEVTPDADSFDVNFSKVNTSEVEGVVSATPSSLAVTGEDATISNTGDPTITGLQANFTEPGQNVKYSFFVHNNGALKAFLKSVTYANVSGKSLPKVCTAKNSTTQDLVDDACDSISVALKVGSASFTGSQASISSHELDVDNYEAVEVTISYDGSGAVADGDFSVEFGDISLVYSSAD